MTPNPAQGDQPVARGRTRGPTIAIPTATRGPVFHAVPQDNRHASMARTPHHGAWVQSCSTSGSIPLLPRMNSGGEARQAWFNDVAVVSCLRSTGTAGHGTSDSSGTATVGVCASTRTRAMHGEDRRLDTLARVRQVRSEPGALCLDRPNVCSRVAASVDPRQ